MKNNAYRRMSLAVALGIILTLVVVAALPAAAPPTQPSQPVQVTNTPLPVDITDTSVAITGSVGIAGTSSVQASPTEPVHARATPSIAEGATASGGGTLFTVPAGKRLVVEYASVLVHAPTGQKVEADFRSSDVASNFIHFMALTPQGTFGNVDDFVGNAPLRGYVDAGGAVDCVIARGVTTGTVTGVCQISGYVVNV